MAMYTPSFNAIAVSNVALNAGADSQLTATRNINFMVFQVEGGGLRFRFDGGSPTTTEGLLLLDGERFEIFGQQRISDFRMIRDGLVDVTVNVALDHVDR